MVGRSAAASCMLGDVPDLQRRDDTPVEVVPFREFRQHLAHEDRMHKQLVVLVKLMLVGEVLLLLAVVLFGVR